MCDEFLRAHLQRLGLDVLTEPVICFRICARVLPLSNLVNLAPWPIGNAVGPRLNPPIRARIPPSVETSSLQCVVQACARLRV